MFLFEKCPLNLDRKKHTQAKEFPPSYFSLLGAVLFSSTRFCRALEEKEVVTAVL